LIGSLGSGGGGSGATFDGVADVVDGAACDIHLSKEKRIRR
jgi:hypothetical protein